MNNDFQKNYAAFIFDWTGFSEKNLIEMNQEHEPDIYGFILLKYDGQLYIADIQWETIAAYDRRGISINLYVAEGECKGYSVTSVTRICIDGSRPRVAVKSNPYYKKTIKELS